MLGKNELSLLKNVVEGVITSTKDSLGVGTVGRKDALKEDFLNNRKTNHNNSIMKVLKAIPL